MDMESDEAKSPYALAVETYLALDFSPDGDAAQALMSGITAEVSGEEINLSDTVGAMPPNMTPAMENWYQIKVAPKRGEALSALTRYFSDLSAAGQASGFILQMREGTLDDQLLSDKRKVYRDHAERFHVESAKIRETRQALDMARRRYDTRKDELGRDAKILNRPLYLGVLTFLIFGSEAALNLESFEALPWATPAIAWGATIVIGLAIGLAAHYHGTVYRQWSYYFDPSESDGKRGAALRMFIGGATALTLALGFVYYARSAYLTAYLSSAGSFGQGSSDGGLAWVVMGSLLGNMLVYLTGVLWAYLLHDSDPDFVDRRIAVNALEKRLAELETRLETFRARSLEQLNAMHRKKLDAARSAHGQIVTQPRFREAQDLFAKVQKQDEAVLGLLLSYRTKLLQGLLNARKVRFVACNDGPHQSYEHITATDYQRRTIKMKYLEA